MTIGERLEQAGVGQPLSALIGACEAAAGQFRLPFNRQSWRGQTGNWAGAGIGSSIDFQDHRPYVPGDDPRYINWQAYARSGHYTMKLYREEVRPQVDLVLDLSESMFVEPAKTARALELFYFACHSAWRSAALLNVTLVRGGELLRPQPESLRVGDWPLPGDNAVPARTASAPDWPRIPWSTQSMRVVVSDFLYEQDPGEAMNLLARNGSQVVLYAVYARSERRPAWLGDVELLECENGQRVRRHFTRQDIEDYHARYEGHFTGWADAATRTRAAFVRVPDEGTLAEQLLATAGPQGGVELCN